MVYNINDYNEDDYERCACSPTERALYLGKIVSVKSKLHMKIQKVTRLAPNCTGVMDFCSLPHNVGSGLVLKSNCNLRFLAALAALYLTLVTQ